MKSLFIILLAGYAVRSDENNYYVIRMPDDPPMQPKKPFKVYWNVPTMQCSSKKIHFENLYENYGIIQNDYDRFKGEKVTILYDPGLFPALFKNETSGKFRFRNGGVPQEGDLTKHLDEFKKELDRSIPDKEFSGIGIIDFESWRPIFRQNFGVLQPYKDVSIEIEKKLHWWWKKAWIEAEAKRRFEEAARTYMQTTLSVAKQLRPNALWGFYGFPYCFNMASNNMVESCASNVPEENDQIPWLWSESTSLYPSVYSSVQLSTSQLVSLIRGRIRESSRCGRTHSGGPAGTILPYFWYRYRDAGFLTETDLVTALATLYESNATGIIIWGSSNDVNSASKCNKLLNYVETVLGPAIAKYTKPSNKFNNESLANTTPSSNNNVRTESPVFNDVSNLSTKLYADSEFHWNPPENYTQEITNRVEEEIRRKFVQNRTNDDDKYAVLQNNSILIDLILNAVLNSVNNVSSTSTDTPKIKNNQKGQQENEDLSSTTELNVKTSTDTSRIANSVVTKNPLLNVANDTSQQVEIQIVDVNVDSPKSVETSTTEKAVIQSDIDKTSSYLKLESDIINSVTETTTTDKSNVFKTTENDYDAMLDNEDDYFFNVETFVKDNFAIIITTDGPTNGITTSDFETKLTKNLKKELQTSIDITINIATTQENMKLEVLSSEFIDVDSTTEIFTESINSTTERNEEIFESSTNSETTTKYVYATETVTNQTEIPPSLLSEEISDEAVESSSHNNGLRDVITEDEDYETLNASTFTTTILQTTTPVSEALESSKSMKNISNITKNLDNTTEGSQTSETTITEETSTSIVPTISTEQVSGSASRLKRSQYYLFCLIFYSISTCLCSLFGQCP